MTREEMLEEMLALLRLMVNGGPEAAFIAATQLSLLLDKLDELDDN